MDLLDQAQLVALGFAVAFEGDVEREGDTIRIPKDRVTEDRS
jgi:hypothetical protein